MEQPLLPTSPFETSSGLTPSSRILSAAEQPALPPPTTITSADRVFMTLQC